MADDKKKQEDKQKKHAHGEGPVTDAKAHAEAKKAGGGGGKKKGARDQKGPKTIQAAEARRPRAASIRRGSASPTRSRSSRP